MHKPGINQMKWVTLYTQTKMFSSVRIFINDAEMLNERTLLI